MKKALLILILFIMVTPVFANRVPIQDDSIVMKEVVKTGSTDYLKYINIAMDKNVNIGQIIDACNEIRNLSDSTPLTKAQLQALRIAARYRIYSIWAMAIKYVDDKDIQRTATGKLGEASSFYINKVNNSPTETDRHINNFLLGVFQYVTGNTTIGEHTITQELNYLRSEKYTKNKAEYLSKIFELTQAFCKKGKTADDVANVLNSIYYKE